MRGLGCPGKADEISLLFRLSDYVARQSPTNRILVIIANANDQFACSKKRDQFLKIAVHERDVALQQLQEYCEHKLLQEKDVPELNMRNSNYLDAEMMIRLAKESFAAYSNRSLPANTIINTKQRFVNNKITTTRLEERKREGICIQTTKQSYPCSMCPSDRTHEVRVCSKCNYSVCSTSCAESAVVYHKESDCLASQILAHDSFKKKIVGGNNFLKCGMTSTVYSFSQYLTQECQDYSYLLFMDLRLSFLISKYTVDDIVVPLLPIHNMPKCGGCQVGHYCCRDCQLADRKVHRPECEFLKTNH